MSIDPDALALLESGGKTAKFPTVNTTVKGKVVAAKSQQATEYGTGKPKTYDNGDPVMEVVITLQTDERDPDDATDDGRRTLYASGRMKKAISEAIQRSGQKLAEGGTLAVKYTGDGEPKSPGMNPPKLYRAEYQPPAPSAIADDESLL